MAAAAAAAGSGAGGVDGDDAADEPKEAEGEVVDAEFEEVGEDKT